MKNKILRIAVFVIMLVSFSITVSASDQSTRSTTLSVTEDGEVMESFAVVGMMPGDTEYQTFDLQITHEDDVEVTYYFLPDDTSSLELLSALQIQVYLPQVDEVLYEGSMEDFTLDTEYIYVEAGRGRRSTVNYEITLYLPSEVGNECMDTQITGEFVWVCEELDDDTSRPDKDDGTSSPDEDDDTSSPDDDDTSDPDAGDKEDATPEDDTTLEDNDQDTSSDGKDDSGDVDDEGDSDGNDDEDDGVIIIPAETGDYTYYMTILTLLIISALIMGLLLYVRNRRKQYE